MNLIKKLASETALYGLSSIVGRFLNYLLVPLYTRALLPGEYGAVSEFYAFSGFLIVLIGFRMESAFFRFGTEKAGRDAAFSTAFRTLFFTATLFLGLVLVFSQNIADLLQYPGHPEYVRWFGIIIAFDALSELPFARLRIEERPRRFVFIKLLGIALTIGLNLFFLLLCPFLFKNGWGMIEKIYSPANQVGYIFLSNVISSVAVFLLLLPHSGGLSKKFDPVLWKKMLVYCGPLVVVGFAGIINEMLDRAMMPHLLPGTIAENRAQLGIYAANYKLAMLISIFTQAYRYAAEPFFFRQAKDKNAPQVMADACRFFTLAASAAMLAVLLFLPVVKGFIDERYHSGLFVVPILLLANVFLGIFYNVSVWYRLKDKTGTGARISLVGAAITIVLNLLLVPKMGFVGAAWATLVCYVFMAVATGLIGQKYLPVPYPVGRLALFVGSSLAVAAVGWGLQRYFLGENWASLIVNGLLFLGWATAFYFLEIKKLRESRS